MASLNFDGSIKTPDNTSYRNIGRAITSTSGVLPNDKGPLVLSTPTWGRSEVEFGTNADKETVQYSTLEHASADKVAESIDDTVVKLSISNAFKPTETDQPEIANKPVSQHGAVHTGNGIAIRNSEADALVSREGNDSVRPPG